MMTWSWLSREALQTQTARHHARTRHFHRVDGDGGGGGGGGGVVGGGRQSEASGVHGGGGGLAGALDSPKMGRRVVSGDRGSAQCPYA